MSAARRKSTKPAERLELGEELDCAYLVFGDEQLLVRRGLERIAERTLEGGPAAFNRADGNAGTEGTIARLVAQARTPPMMGPRRLVVVREIENAKPEEVEALMAYLGSPCPSTVLVLVGKQLPPAIKGSNPGIRLRNAVAKVGQAVRFQTSRQDPVAFTRQRCARAGCQLGVREAELLVEVVGRDLGRLQGEVDKLVAFVGGEGRIGPDHVEQVCSLLAETVVFELTDAIVRGEAGTALAISHRLLEEGNAPSRILPLLAWQVRQLVLLQDCLLRRANPYDEGIRMPSAKLGAAKRSLQRRPLRPERVLAVLARATKRMRVSRADERHVFEALVLELASG